MLQICHTLRFSSLRCYSKESQNIFYLGIVLREEVSVSPIRILRSKIFLLKYRQLGSAKKIRRPYALWRCYDLHGTLKSCCVIIFHVMLLRCNNEILGVPWKEYMAFILNCEQNDFKVTDYHSRFSELEIMTCINTKSTRTEWSRFKLVILWL